MSIIVKHGDNYYEIPDDILNQSKITKAEFKKGLEHLSAHLASQTDGLSDFCNFIDLSAFDVSDLES